MGEKIIRQSAIYEEVEIPDGFEVCSFCKGKGLISKYDQGWRSIAHDRGLAALHECDFCNGEGYVYANR